MTSGQRSSRPLTLLLDEPGHENWVAVGGMNLPMVISAYGERMGGGTAAEVAKAIYPEAKSGVCVKPESLAPAEAAPVAAAAAPVKQGAIPEGTVLGDGHIKIAAVRIGEEATLKHFYRSGDVVQLIAENSAVCPPMVYAGTQLDEMAVEGLAVGICRSLV